MAKDSFLLYYELEENISDLTDAQLGALFRAIFAYEIRGEPYAGDDPEVRMAMRFVRRQLDRSRDKYDSIVEKRREAGRKGGKKHNTGKQTQDKKQDQANASKCLQKQTNANKQKQTQANQAVPVPVSVPVSVPESVGATPPTRARDESKQDPQSQKVQWAEKVTMTNEEHEKLVKAYGPADTALMIEHLGDYKAATGKKYDDDYRAILSWVVSWLQERRPMTGGFQRVNRAPGPADQTQIPREEKERQILENERWMREYLDKAKEEPNEPSKK